MRTSEEYRGLLQRLLPRGRVWNRENDSYLGQLLLALADEFSRLDERVNDLVVESRISETEELISEYEEDYGIVDDSSTILPERVAAIYEKFLALGEEFPQYFIDLADALGYTITIEEFTPAWSGLGAAGDPCGDQFNLFFWKTWVACNGVIGDYESGPFDEGFSTIASNVKEFFQNEVTRSFWDLIAEFFRLTEAHMMPLFDFHGRDFNRGYGVSFWSYPTNDASIPMPDFDEGFGGGFMRIQDYDGEYLIGSFDHAFYLDYDAKFGGAFGGDFAPAEVDVPV